MAKIIDEYRAAENDDEALQEFRAEYVRLRNKQIKIFVVAVALTAIVILVIYMWSRALLKEMGLPEEAAFLSVFLFGFGLTIATIASSFVERRMESVNQEYIDYRENEYRANQKRIADAMEKSGTPNSTTHATNTYHSAINISLEAPRASTLALTESVWSRGRRDAGAWITGAWAYLLLPFAIYAVSALELFEMLDPKKGLIISISMTFGMAAVAWLYFTVTAGAVQRDELRAAYRDKLVELTDAHAKLDIKGTQFRGINAIFRCAAGDDGMPLVNTSVEIYNSGDPSILENFRGRFVLDHAAHEFAVLKSHRGIRFGNSTVSGSYISSSAASESLAKGSKRLVSLFFKEIEGEHDPLTVEQICTLNSTFEMSADDASGKSIVIPHFPAR